MHIAQVNSKAKNVNENIQIIAVYIKKDKSIVVKTSQLGEIPLFILLRGMGIVTDYDITKYIVNDMSDSEMINILQVSSEMSITPGKPIDEKNQEIKTQDQAKDYLVEKIKYMRKYSDTDLEIQKQQKRSFRKNFKKDVLPHLR